MDRLKKLRERHKAELAEEIEKIGEEAMVIAETLIKKPKEERMFKHLGQWFRIAELMPELNLDVTPANRLVVESAIEAKGAIRATYGSEWRLPNAGIER